MNSRLVYTAALSVCLLALVTAKPASSPSSHQVEFLRRIMPLQTHIGQIGGLDTDSTGNLVVFHRSDRKWSFDSFFFDRFNTLKYGPIKKDVLALIDPATMQVVDSWGANRFYMPHGLTVDSDSNVWLTDVGLHQVFKFDLNSSPDEPLLVLGERLEKGDDEAHFCKPTGVAVAALSGDVFVADGYCNERVVQFDAKGRFVKEFMDRDVAMQVVHSVVLLESEGLVCAASREDGR